MIFLIEYDRSAATLRRFDSFEDSARESAEQERLSIEIANLKKGISLEIVLLEAVSEADLRRTHGRYFESVGELANRSIH